MLKLKRLKVGKYLPGLLSIADLVVINILFGISLLITRDFMDPGRLRMAWVLVSTSYFPLLFWYYRQPHYHRAITLDNIAKDAFTIVIVHGLFFVSLVAYVNLHISLHELVVFYSLMGVFIPLWIVATRGIVKLLRRRGLNFVRVAIIGSGPVAERLKQELLSDAGFGYKIMGIFSDTDSGGKHTIDYLASHAKDYNLDQIFYTLPGTEEKSLTKVLKIADDNMIQFYYVPQIPRRISRSFELHRIGCAPVLSMRRNPLSDIINRTIKRTFDIVFSSAVLIVLTPLVFVPVAIAIKATSKGPIFFKQERTGYKGRTFKCWKFRTMTVNSQSDSVQATKSDPRITPIGSFLRHSSIDELPQFINVILGDMSVVGPRPHMLKHTKEYTELIGPYMVRHIVKPGITGWAQVNGYRGITDELWKMERRVEHDVWYIENWTFLLDLKIICRTVINAAIGEQNAF